MDLYIVQVDGLDVSFTYSQGAAVAHGRRLCSEDPSLKVQVLRVNMEARQIDLGLVEILERVREGERAPRRIRATPKRERLGQRRVKQRRERRKSKGSRRK